MKTIKLCTWNVNGIRASYEKGLSQFVKDQKPDFLCVQETKAHIEQVEPEKRNLGYLNTFWSSAERKGYSGVATFTNDEPFKVSKTIGFPEYENEGRIIWTQHMDFDLYNIYFPNGASGQTRHLFKQKFLKDLNEHLNFEIKKGKEIVVVGDYNVAYLDIDVYDPIRLSSESGFLPQERDWFKEFLGLGFVDTYRYLHPDNKKMYSWWSYKDMARVKNNGWRIDYICVTEGLVSKLKSCEILMEQVGSDHCPVVAEFEF